MEFSKHNIISRIPDSDKYFIINLLSKEADILSDEKYRQFIGGMKPSEEFINKGYFVDPEEEKRRFRESYLEFIENRDTDEIQLFFVPGYNCNFSCSYCYQDQYKNISIKQDTVLIDAFFEFIHSRFRNRRKYITVFGGEPLLNSASRKKYISYLVEKSVENKMDIAFVTNGYYLTEYSDILKKGNIREVQVTLDGLEEMHNKRRPLGDGAGTFTRIVSGIDHMLSLDIPINLRMVIDRENIDELPFLAEFAVKRGWTKSPFFKTQIGRNYELHHCQSESQKLYSRIGLYKDIFNLISAHPVILEFHKPAFSVSRFLFEQGELPDPLFDSCPGAKTEFAFDYTGRIYSCTATVGKAGEELGTFYPDVNIDDEKLASWEQRDVVAIPECRACNLQLACGGGCGAVAKNTSGNICTPDCRPVKELLEMGLLLYFRNEIQ